MPSQIFFQTWLRMLTTPQAANIPKKNVIKMDRLAVFIEINTGDQSMFYLSSRPKGPDSACGVRPCFSGPLSFDARLQRACLPRSLGIFYWPAENP